MAQLQLAIEMNVEEVESWLLTSFMAHTMGTKVSYPFKCVNYSRRLILARCDIDLGIYHIERQCRDRYLSRGDFLIETALSGNEAAILRSVVAHALDRPCSTFFYKHFLLVQSVLLWVLNPQRNQ